MGKSAAAKGRTVTGTLKLCALGLVVASIGVFLLPHLKEPTRLSSRDAAAVVLFLLAALVGLWPSYRRAVANARWTADLSRPPFVLYALTALCTAAVSVATATILQPGRFLWVSSRWECLAPTIVLCVWFVSPLFGRTRKRFTAEGRGFEPDAPIMRAEDDELRRRPFVLSLAQAVYRVPLNESAVIGLYGAWGEGKSSVLNLLRDELKRRQGVAVVDFDPWSCSGETGIISGFFARIATELADEPGGPAIGEYLRKVGVSLTLGLPPASINMRLPTSRGVSLVDLRQCVEDFLSHAGLRLVVILDDVDRLTLPELLAVFKLVRVNANLPSVVFLLSMDAEQVSDALQEGGLRREYINKVVQIARRLPTPQPGGLRALLEGRLRKMVKAEGPWTGREPELEGEESRAIVESVEVLLSTPREVKLIANQMGWLLDDLSRAIHLGDLLGMAALEVLAPAVIEDIRRNREHYVVLDLVAQLRLESMSLATRDKKTTRTQSAQHLNEVVKKAAGARRKSEGTLRHMLAKLFFIGIGPVFENTSYEDSGQYKARKRIASAEVLDFFLQQQASPGVMPAHEIEKLVQDAQAAEDSADYFGQLLNQVRADGTAVQVFDGMLLFEELFTPKSALSLARVIAAEVESLESSAGDPFATEYATAVRLFVRLAEDRVDEGELRQLLTDTVATTPSLFFAYEVCYVLDPERDGLERLKKYVPSDELVRLLQERIKKEVVEEKLDITKLRQRHGFWRRLIDVLASNWWKYDGRFRELTDSYVDWLTDQSPEHLATFVGSFIESPPFKPKVDLRWRDAYDIDGLARKARDLLAEKTPLSDSARLVLSRFLEGMEAGYESPRSDSKGKPEDTAGQGHVEDHDRTPDGRSGQEQ